MASSERDFAARDWLAVTALLTILAVPHIIAYQPSEPFYNNDETRHVMTGVFLNDLLRNGLVQNPYQYAVRYYMQYPALGIGLYPPLFYIVEGALMFILGVSVFVGKGLVLAFLGLGCVYMYLLARRCLDSVQAMAATLTFGLSPLVFELSRQVMLEIPTLGLALVGAYHFDRYQASGHSRDLWVAVLGCACAMLMRYSGIFMLSYLAVTLLLRRDVRLLARREVILAGIAAATLVLPAYAVGWVTIGRVHVRQTMEGLGVGSRELTLLDRIVDYPMDLPLQMGWAATVLATIGLGVGLKRLWSGRFLPWIALIVATYVTFSPMAIHSPRFVIYWVPAFAVFAIVGVYSLCRLSRAERLAPWFVGVLVLAIAVKAIGAERPYLYGYKDIARYVTKASRWSRYCLFDGALNGNFIYQVRSNDPDRRLWVLRGDRILYSVQIQPSFGYKDTLKTQEEVIQVLKRYDPEFLIVEEPPTFKYDTPAGRRLRVLLQSHPERYELVMIRNIESNYAAARGSKLLVYRSLVRSSSEVTEPEFELPALGRKLGRAKHPPSD